LGEGSPERSAEIAHRHDAVIDEWIAPTLASLTSSDFRWAPRSQTEHFGAAKYPSFGEAIGQLQTINQIRADGIAASVRGACGAKRDRRCPAYGTKAR
jgi:hypothetical protein